MSMPAPRVVDLDRDTVREGLAQGEILVVDVREPHEFAMGHMPGAVSLPLSAFDPALLPADAGKRVVFSCAAGVRSIHALAIAQAAGLPLFEHYRGGFKDWAMAGEAIEA